MQDVQDLCSSINLHQKYDKICRKLRSNLQDIEKAREQVCFSTVVVVKHVGYTVY